MFKILFILLGCGPPQIMFKPQLHKVAFTFSTFIAAVTLKSQGMKKQNILWSSKNLAGVY